MGQNLTTDTTGQVPKVPRPHPLDGKIMRQLAANCLNQPADAFANTQLEAIQLRCLAIFSRYRKLQSLFFQKFLPKGLRKISAITQKQSRIGLGQFSEHMDVVHIGRGQVEGLYHADGIDLHVQPEPVESLIAQFFSICRQALKQLAAFRSGKAADCYWKAVDHLYSILEPFG